MAQQIRLSQFVIIYGPGAIIEGPRGPRVILLPDIGFFSPNHLNPENFEISDQRMSQGLLNGARIFRLPSNAELGYPEGYYLYRTKPFPSWSLCLNYSRHSQNCGILYQGNSCPECGERETQRQKAIRFVSACPKGHMDDVDWFYIVHMGSHCRHVNWFLWHGGGGSLSQVEIECPECGKRVNLGFAYGRSWPCSGRYPEREPPRSSPLQLGCTQNSRIIQRQASNLRIPELRTLFTIFPRYTQLHRLLELTQIRSVLVADRSVSSSEKRFRNMLRNLVEGGMLPQATANEILNHPWEEIQRAIRDILLPSRTQFQDLLLDEFNVLIDASVNGVPPIHSPRPTSKILFEVIPDDVRTISCPNGRNLRVTPVSRLNTVTVQIGYRREIRTRSSTNTTTPQASIVHVSFRDNKNQEWYPGVEFLGEGVFIMFDDNEGLHFPLRGEAARLWQQTYENPQGYSQTLFRTPLTDEVHPVFVWWHTLSHLLIRAVSVDAGYSSASIRERVYLQVDGEKARGGVILYATQPGSEGTLGGLTALVPQFEIILERALDMARACSNDPLCLENHFSPGGYTGPACYGCLHVSETSCEHRNLWLDRELFLENLP